MWLKTEFLASLCYSEHSRIPHGTLALVCTSLKAKARRPVCMLAAAFHKGTYMSCKNRHHDKLLLGRRPGEAQPVWPPGSVSWGVPPPSGCITEHPANGWVNLSKYKIQNVPATFIIFILLNQRGTCKGKCRWWEGFANPTLMTSCRADAWNVSGKSGWSVRGKKTSSPEPTQWNHFPWSPLLK